MFAKIVPTQFDNFPLYMRICLKKNNLNFVLEMAFSSKILSLKILRRLTRVATCQRNFSESKDPANDSIRSAKKLYHANLPYRRQKYEEAFDKSIKDPESYWAEQAEQLVWFKKWDRVLDDKNRPFTKWFVGGEMNTCYNALDRHVRAGLGSRTALIYDSPVTSVKRKYSYAEMLDLVSNFAGVLANHGVKRGDRVLIYMPMIPEAFVGMLACARIGAIHSVVLGGFAAKELSSRISHCEPKIILTASGGVEPTRVVEYKPILDEAIELSTAKPQSCIVYQRQSVHFPQIQLKESRDYDWKSECDKAKAHDCVPVPATDPLYILYTSGTTGLPKGVVRPSGGHAVVLPWSLQTIYGMIPGEVWWASSDLGWVVGHSYACYGPLLLGLTSVLYEGKPVGTPDSTQFMRIIDEYEVASLFCAPTALRGIREVNHEKNLRAKYRMKNLRFVFSAGEHLDQETRHWAETEFHTPVLDHWWQTESGWPITATCVGSYDQVPKQPTDASGKPVPGWNVKVLTEDGNREAKPGELGRITIKSELQNGKKGCATRSSRIRFRSVIFRYFRLPLPPGCLSTFWRNDEKFRDLYFKTYPGYYDAMDAGSITEDGYICVMSRADDVINVAGHRISGGAIEEAVLEHKSVVDCAVIAVKDQLKGAVPVAVCVLSDTFEGDLNQVKQEVIDLVRKGIGPVAAMKKAVVVKKLPKTRSGKIARNTLAAMANNKPYSIPVTIEDASVYPAIENVFRKEGLLG